jgi:dihydropteroate synthase
MAKGKGERRLTFPLFPFTLLTLMEKREWKLSSRTLRLGERTLLMGVLNVTPDSFSDGGQFNSTARALLRAEEMIEEGADILDIGGESTRPGAETVTTAEEMRRVVPVIEALMKKTSVPLSVDTTKAEVARAALAAGAEIVNDISGLRFEPEVAQVAASARAGLVLMHSRGPLSNMHSLEPVADIMKEVAESLRASIAEAERRGVERERLVLDPGIGFGKSQAQNLELIAKLKELAREFAGFPLLIGTSRKSFIGRVLAGAPASERLHGTMATVTAAILNGADIVRVHDVRAAAETARVADALKNAACPRDQY